MKDFTLLEAAAKQLGLELNRKKCEIVGLSDGTRSLFASQGINLPETSPADIILLGAPLSAVQNLDAVLESKCLELQRLSKRLELMPSHDSLHLLRNVLTAPRLMYLLRTAPCTGSPELSKFDAVLWESVSTTLNIDLGDDRWTQASLPVRLGGLGIRSVASLAPSAYLASAASTEKLTSSLLPTRLRDVIDSDIAITVVSAWFQLATRPSTTSTIPSPPASISPVQRVWDSQCCEVQADLLLDAAADVVDRARLQIGRAHV